MNPNTALAILTGVLVLITAYYAWTTHKLLGTVRDMVAATRDVADVTAKTYALSVAPQVECRTVTYDGAQNQSADATMGELISETTVTNVGTHRVRLSRVRLETDSHGEQVRRFVARWMGTHDSETVRIPFAKSKHTKVLVHLEDMAGQEHVVVAEHLQGPAKDEVKSLGG
jgi:hypothetical protein